jgi:hypothetical protein
MGMIQAAAGGTAAVIAAAGLALPAVGSSAPGSSPCSRRPHLSEGRILGIARRAAADAGDRRPTLIQHSQGTRHRANKVDSGDGVPGCRWSYLIAERGHFILRDAHRPPGAPPPRGTVLTLVLDAQSADITDLGLSNRYPHLRRLGPVTTDLRRSKRDCTASPS